jgi:hypothetical protein
MTTKRAPNFSKEMLLRIAENECGSTADFLQHCSKRRALASPVDCDELFKRHEADGETDV